MKNHIVLTALISLSAFTGIAQANQVTVNLNSGESAKFIVDGCKGSEYGAMEVKKVNPENIREFKSVIALCKPKTCVFYNPLMFGGKIGSVFLYPDNKVLAKGLASAQVKPMVEKYLRDGTCGKSKKWRDPSFGGMEYKNNWPFSLF